MVAPLIAGLGALASLAGVGLAAILGKKEYLWVASPRGGALVAHKAASSSEAQTLQANFAKSGRASILIRQAADGTLTSENFTPGVAVSEETKKAMKAKWQGKPVRFTPGRGIKKGFVTMRRSMANPGGAMDVSTPEIEIDVTQKPEDRVPTASAWQAQVGPYPETPRFYTTPSSHEYQTLVETQVLPARFQTPTFFNEETKDLVHIIRKR